MNSLMTYEYDIHLHFRCATKNDAGVEGTLADEEQGKRGLPRERRQGKVGCTATAALRFLEGIRFRSDWNTYDTLSEGERKKQKHIINGTASMGLQPNSAAVMDDCND